MKKKRLLFLFVIVSLVVFGGCKKEEDPQKVFQRQMEQDELLIKQFIEANKINAIRDASGVYYEILSPAKSNFKFVKGYDPTIIVRYTGRLLDGKLVLHNREGRKTTLGSEILGWQIGLQLIGQGGKIRLIIPSGYAYGTEAYGEIPPYSNLDFEIELIDIK